MPPLETMDRRQRAVLWERDGQYDAYGNPKTAPPVEIDVRWTARRHEMTGPDGTPLAVDATAVVDRDVSMGSNLWLGTLDEWYGVGSAGAENGLMVAVAFSSATDVKHRYTRRTVGMTAFRDQRLNSSQGA